MAEYVPHVLPFLYMISAVLLSGGLGSRFGATIPKQYLPIKNKPIVLYALEALLSYPHFQEIAIVCDPAYHPIFAHYAHRNLIFALPGSSRQQSLFSGIDALSSCAYVCIHDAARPLLRLEDLLQVITIGKETGAAALATPVTSTIKKAHADHSVAYTLERDRLWVMQTPQVLSTQLMQKGRRYIQEQNIVVTDDISLAEVIGHTAQLVPGSTSNIKITHQEDLLLAQLLLERLND